MISPACLLGSARVGVSFFVASADDELSRWQEKTTTNIMQIKSVGLKVFIFLMLISMPICGININPPIVDLKCIIDQETNSCLISRT